MTESEPLAQAPTPTLTVDGEPLVTFQNVVSVRGPALDGGRCTAIYYSHTPPPRGAAVNDGTTSSGNKCFCLPHATSNRTAQATSSSSKLASLRRYVADVDDPASTPYATAYRQWRPLHGQRILLVVNPVSGKRCSRQVITRMIAPLFRDAGLEVDIQFTSHAGHASEIVTEAINSNTETIRQNSDLRYSNTESELRTTGDDSSSRSRSTGTEGTHFPVSERSSGYLAVISVGGDGTLHEVVNGLLRRTRKTNNADRPVGNDQLPYLGVIPCGSGNAIAESMGTKTPLTAALGVLHALRTGQDTPVALFQYGRIKTMQRRNSDPARDAPRELVSLCGLMWGLTANADIGTEPLRWMGDARFDVGGLSQIMLKKAAYAKLRLRLHQPLQHGVDKMLERSGGGSRGRLLERAGEEDVVIEGRFVLVVAWACSHVSRTTCLTTYAKLDEPCMDVVLVREGKMSRVAMIKTMLSLSQNTDAYLHATDGVEYYKCRRLCFDEIEGDYLTVDGESVPVAPCFLSMAPETGEIRLLRSGMEGVSDG